MKAAVFATPAVLMVLMVLPAPGLAGWHLMAPSCAPARTVTLNDGSKTLEPVGCDPVDTGVGIRRLASLSKWKSLGTLDSVDACDNPTTALIKQTSDAYSEALQRDGILNPTTREEPGSPLAPLAPHQPRPTLDAAHALARGGVAAGQGGVPEGARAEESSLSAS